MHTLSQLPLDGASRVYFIVGDPIAQVKSPAGVTRSMVDQGRNAVVVPAHVHAADLSSWAAAASLSQNVDGIIVTVPHKMASLALCASASECARFVGAVNVMRRNLDGSWHGDMFDGEGFVRALRRQGGELAGRSVLLAGAGGAGSAIAHAFVLAGVRRLAIHDADPARRDALIARLSTLGRAEILAGSNDPYGFDLAINATPMGMQQGDPLPLNANKLAGAQFAGCVITSPPVSPWIEVARAKGCKTMVGADMFAEVKDLMVEFLLAPTLGAGGRRA